MSEQAAIPRVDFYVLESSASKARLLYACRLIEKAYEQSQTVYVHTDDAAEAALVDELLWTFAEKSFVPHALAGDGREAPVQIGCTTPVAAQVLVNLGAEPPGLEPGYERIAEFVDADPLRREQGRRRFAWYRDRGLRAETHKVADSGRA